MQEKIQHVIDFFSNVEGISFDGERYVVSNTKMEQVDLYNITYDEYGDTLRLQIKRYFNGESVKYLEALESEIKSADINLSLLIVSLAGIILTYNPITDIISEFGTKNENISTQVENLIAYYKLFNYFKTSPFCDYYNSANDQIIFYSSTHGIIKIKHDVIPPKLNNFRIKERVNEILALAKPIEVSSFLKNSFYTISNGTGILDFKEIINKSDGIISITKRDYELVAKKFDFDKFRDSLYKEKENFFKEIREIIGKIFSQAVGIPISISASVFATYKVSDDTLMLVLVLLAFSLYVAFYIKIQCIYKKDLKEIENDFVQSFSIIQSKSGLPINTINIEKDKIERKISSTQDIIFWSILLVSFLALLVVVYIIYEITTNETFSLIKILLRKN